MIKDVYLAAGVRTPFGSMNGSLGSLTASQLGSIAIRETLKQVGVGAEAVDEVYFGNVIQAGIGQNVARQASLGAGIGANVGAVTINKVCGSSLRAVIIASQAIQCGDAGLIVAGGCESMTNAPYLLPKARQGYRMGNGELIDAMIHDGLWDVYNDKHMGACGDMCAAKYDFSREDQDAYAIASYQRAAQAWDSGFYAGAVVPVEVKSRKETVVVDRDEDVARFREEKMRALRPAFGPEGTVTAGNASGINDGAASLVVLGEEKMKSLGIKPGATGGLPASAARAGESKDHLYRTPSVARVLGYANAATDPEWFTVAPVHAIRKLGEKLSLKLDDVDLFEINEAFSVVPMVAMRELGLAHAKVNVFGGAVAIGHPIGATGARLVNTLIRGLQHTGGKIGIACLCIGGGEADAIAVERVAE